MIYINKWLYFYALYIHQSNYDKSPIHFDLLRLCHLEKYESHQLKIYTI